MCGWCVPPFPCGCAPAGHHKGPHHGFRLRAGLRWWGGRGGPLPLWVRSGWPPQGAHHGFQLRAGSRWWGGRGGSGSPVHPSGLPPLPPWVHSGWPPQGPHHGCPRWWGGREGRGGGGYPLPVCVFISLLLLWGRSFGLRVRYVTSIVAYFGMTFTSNLHSTEAAAAIPLATSSVCVLP